MNPEVFINALGLIVLPVIWYALSRISAIQKELDAHKLHVAEEYLKKGDFNIVLEKIEKTLGKIFEKLDMLTERRNQERNET